MIKSQRGDRHGEPVRRRQGYVKDFYEVLGVNESATTDEIEKAYRQLAKKYHPDVSKEPDAEEKFKAVQQAYQTLKNPLERSFYDQIRQQSSREKNFEPDGDAYRYWQSPPPPRKTVLRRLLHAAIVLFWLMFAMGSQLFRTTILSILTIALAIFQRLFPVVGIFLFLGGFIFQGNPLEAATWTSNPKLAFMCFGFPIIVYGFSLQAYRWVLLLWHQGDLFPSLQNKLNALRYRSLCL